MGLRHFSANATNFFCCLENFLITFGFHIRNVFGLERKVPSPEQGASTRILSNFGKLDLDSWEQKEIASFLVMIVFVTPHFPRFDERILILSIFKSFAIIVPWFCMYIAIWEVLLPGDAQRSRISSFGFGFRAMGGSIEETSWM